MQIYLQLLWKRQTAHLIKPLLVSFEMCVTVADKCSFTLPITESAPIAKARADWDL